MMVPFLYSISFYDIKPYYDDGKFIELREYLHQKRDNILSDIISPEHEYQLLYIDIFEAKIIPEFK